MILRLSLILWVLIFVTPAFGGSTKPPKVIVSIAPIHSLVASIMKGIGTPELLVKGGISPHNASLRPSQMRSLSQAELIFWLGEEAEGFLKQPLENASSRQRIVKVIDLPELLLLPLRRGGIWEGHSHAAEDVTDTPHGHEHRAQRPESIDSHIWLDPFNAKIIAQAVADILGEIDTERASQYQENAKRLIFRLDNLHLEIGDVTVAAINKPYIVFHDAYQYFEYRYHLKAAGSVTLDPDHKPGARRLREIQQKLQETQAHCIFSEPQFPSSHLKALVGEDQYYSNELDPIGVDILPGPDMYFILMRRLVSDFVSCLCQIYIGDELKEEAPITTPQ